MLGAALAAVFLLPAMAVAHADLQTSDPAQGAVVPSPFAGPIVLTFSEPLAKGSKADLIGSNGATVAGTMVDVTAMTMTIALTAPLDPGAYEIRWVSIADDGDVLRQPIVKFAVAPAPSPSTPVATATTSAVVSAAPTTATPSMAAVSSAPSPSLAPTREPSGSSDTTGNGGDVVVPIIVALVVLGAGAAYLLTRRNRPAGPA